MVGAGFASGREIMQFFSRYGAFSWVLIVYAAGITFFMLRRMLTRRPMGDSMMEKALLSLFFITVGGGMTAASGELWALTVPFPCARTAGRLITLAVCLRLAGGSLRGMAFLGRTLLPLLLAALLLCLRVPGDGSALPSVSGKEALTALVLVTGYCGLNGMTAAGVFCGDANPWMAKKRNHMALGCGLLTGLLLAAGNAALLPHAARLGDAALPTVTLLRAYGKTGYYLAAAVLYSASATTLIAVLRGLLTIMPLCLRRHEKSAVGLTVLAVSLLGFSEIVAAAYPALGWAYLIMILLPARKKEPVGG